MGFELEEGKMFDKSIGLRIRSVRDNLGWSRERLAEEAKISRTTVYNVENGIRGTTAETLARVCLALNVTSDYILYGAENKPIIINQKEKIKANLQESLDMLDKD